MTAGAVWLCRKHQRAIAEGAECYWCLQDENEALRAEVTKLRSTVSFLRSTLCNCAAHAGLPDPATGCRAIIATVKDALAIP